MNPEILRQFVGSHFQMLMLAVIGVSCLVTVAFWTTLYRRRGDEVPSEAWSLLPDGIRNGKDRRRLSDSILRVLPGTEPNLLKTLVYARKNDPDRPLRVEFPEGVFHFDQSLRSLDRLRFEGTSDGRSILRPTVGEPALRFENVDDCMIRGFTIQGEIRCTESDLTIHDCVVENKNGGAGIEAAEGSTVTFSGTISSAGGRIAIRASGNSRVILQSPFAIHDDDRILMEPGCQVVF